MHRYSAWTQRLQLALLIGWAIGGVARGSVHVNYDVVNTFSTSGFSASWVHSAESGLNGSADNGALYNGDISSRVTGKLEGDLSGNVLSNITGSVDGLLKQLSGYLNSQLGTNLATCDPFELRLGIKSAGGKGALAFETNGSGTGQFTGGFLDFSLYAGNSAASLLNGTFFFKPQAESGSAALSPNRGDANIFTLWGWNWMHDGAPVDGGAEPDWSSFLSGLGYTGPKVLRTPDGSAVGIPAALGIALYVVDPLPDGGTGGAAPEPMSAIVWGLLVGIGLVTYRCQTKR